MMGTGKSESGMAQQHSELSSMASNVATQLQLPSPKLVV
jgi:hypothetical protein